MPDYVHFKAGPTAINLIRSEGLRPERIKTFIGPAGGPKWFLSVGFDKALIRTGFLANPGNRVLLAGSSAGAWRNFAFACRNPLESYERLRLAYSRNVFTREDTPVTVARALWTNVTTFISQGDIEHILSHPHFDLAVHTVNCRSLTRSENQRIQGFGILLAAMSNVFSPKILGTFFERTIFYTGGLRTGLSDKFAGKLVQMTRDNLLKAALATGSLPYIVSGVQNIPDAPPGVYRDGGITDYQLNQDYCAPPDSLALFYHYQERIVPGWFDKPFKSRRPEKSALENVLQVYPGHDFVKMLPDSRIPDRTDFTRFVDAPDERIKRWDEVARLSDVIAEEFFEAVESGKIRQLVKPI